MSLFDIEKVVMDSSSKQPKLPSRARRRDDLTPGDRLSIREPRPLGPCRFAGRERRVGEADRRWSLEPFFFAAP
jgi:hypothetical protein